MSEEVRSPVEAGVGGPERAGLFSGLMRFARDQDVRVGLIALGVQIVLGSLMFAGTLSLLLRALVRSVARSVARSLELGFLLGDMTGGVKLVSFWRLWGAALLGIIVLAGLTILLLTALGAARDAWPTAIGTYAVAVGAHLFVLNAVLLIALILSAVVPSLAQVLLVGWLGSYFIGAYEIWQAEGSRRLTSALVLLFGLALVWSLSVYVLVRVVVG